MRNRHFTFISLSANKLLFAVLLCFFALNANYFLFAQLPNHGCDHLSYCGGTPNWITKTKIVPVPGHPFCYARVEYVEADNCEGFLNVIKISNIQYMGGCQNLLTQIYPFGVNGPPNEIVLRQLYGEIQKVILGSLMEEEFLLQTDPAEKERWYCTKPDGSPNPSAGSYWQNGLLNGACMSLCTAYLEDNNDPTKYIIGHKYLDCVENNCCTMIHFYCIDRNTNKAVFLNGQSINHGLNNPDCVATPPPTCPIFSSAGYTVISTYNGNCQLTCPEAN